MINEFLLTRILMNQSISVYAAATASKSFQSCPTLCNPIDGSPPGSPVPGILQARTLEWVAISFSFSLHESENWKWSRSVVSDPQRPHGRQPTRLLCPWDFPGKSTRVEPLPSPISVYTDDELEFVWLMVINKIPFLLLWNRIHIYMYL